MRDMAWSESGQKAGVLAVALGVAAGGVLVARVALHAAREIATNETVREAVAAVPPALRRGAVTTAEEVAEHAGEVLQNSFRRLIS